MFCYPYTVHFKALHYAYTIFLSDALNSVSSSLPRSSKCSCDHKDLLCSLTHTALLQKRMGEQGEGDTVMGARAGCFTPRLAELTSVLGSQGCMAM